MAAMRERLKEKQQMLRDKLAHRKALQTELSEHLRKTKTAARGAAMGAPHGSANAVVPVPPPPPERVVRNRALGHGNLKRDDDDDDDSIWHEARGAARPDMETGKFIPVIKPPEETGPPPATMMKPPQRAGFMPQIERTAKPEPQNPVVSPPPPPAPVEQQQQQQPAAPPPAPVEQQQQQQPAAPPPAPVEQQQHQQQPMAQEAAPVAAPEPAAPPAPPPQPRLSAAPPPPAPPPPKPVDARQPVAYEPPTPTTTGSVPTGSWKPVNPLERGNKPLNPGGSAEKMQQAYKPHAPPKAPPVPGNAPVPVPGVAPVQGGARTLEDLAREEVAYPEPRYVPGQGPPVQPDALPWVEPPAPPPPPPPTAAAPPAHVAAASIPAPAPARPPAQPVPMRPPPAPPPMPSIVAPPPPRFDPPAAAMPPPAPPPPPPVPSAAVVTPPPPGVITPPPGVITPPPSFAPPDLTPPPDLDAAQSAADIAAALPTPMVEPTVLIPGIIEPPPGLGGGVAGTVAGTAAAGINTVEEVLLCKEKLNIVVVASECAPFAKTGGLGDVAAALPKALRRRGHRVMVVMPRYKDYQGVFDTSVRVHYNIMGANTEVGYFHMYKNDVDYVFVDHVAYHAVAGDIYAGDREEANFRNAMLCQAAIEAVWHVKCGPEGDTPYGDSDLVFLANDWHTALLPVMLQAFLTAITASLSSRGPSSSFTTWRFRAEALSSSSTSSAFPRTTKTTSSWTIRSEASA